MNKLTTEDIMQHAGVKGMKWGVRKKAPKREIKALVNNETRRKPSTGGVGLVLAVQGTPLAAPMAAGVAIQSFKQGRARKRKIAKALGGRPTDFKRKDLKNASGLVKNYEGVKLVSNGKSVKMATNLDEVLLHVGVKGMKWGVIRSASAKAAAKAKSGGKAVASKVGDNAAVNRVKEQVKSSKREASWSKIKTDNMSSSEIAGVAKRIQMENDFKRLSSNKSIAGRKDKKDYRNRESMSDQELTSKLTRLRAKDNLDRNTKQASKAQKDLGKKVLSVAGPLVLKHVLGEKIDAKDVLSAIQNKGDKDAKAEMRNQVAALAGKKVVEAMAKKAGGPF